MKYIKNFEKYGNRRKVYWIVPFESNKFEDAIDSVKAWLK